MDQTLTEAFCPDHPVDEILATEGVFVDMKSFPVIFDQSTVLQISDHMGILVGLADYFSGIYEEFSERLIETNYSKELS